MEQKRYFWLKLQHDFFASKRIKKLRSIAGGDTYLIIYLKMQLLSIKTDGVLTYTGLEKDFASELALDLDESPDDVAVTLTFLRSAGLIETSDEVDFLLPYARENTGAETADAGRKREIRARQKAERLLQSSDNVRTMSGLCPGEIEKELEIDKEREYRERKTAKRFSPPTVEQVREYCRERNNKIDAERFVSFYESKGWTVGKSPMKDWKAAVRNWERPGDESRGRSAQHDEIPQTYDGAEFFKRAVESSYGGGRDG